VKFKSKLQELNPVPFPEFTGERVYMKPFDPSRPLPEDLSRWQPTIDAMMVEAPKDRICYLLLDQKVVRRGESQRRPGVHIDGYWSAEISAHSGGGRHNSTPRPNPDRGPRKTPGTHRPIIPGTHFKGLSGSSWSDANFAEPEALLLASDIFGSCGYVGEFEGQVGERGDCSHIDISHLMQQDLVGGIGYVGNITFLHESVPLPVEIPRTLVRINVPGWAT
jgi:hypothetical protein